MKKTAISKLMSLILALTFVLSFATPLGRAAQPCTVTMSDPTVTVGNNVTINVQVSGNVGAALIQLVFDPNYLQYISGDLGDGYVNGSMVQLYRMYSSGSGSMSFSMTFKTLKTGNTTIDWAYSDIVDGNGDPMDVTPGWSAVTINAQPTASSNANLGSLSISPGTLSPGFSSGTTSYKASVSNSTTSVAVSATAADAKAKVAVWGNTGLSVGNNTVTVQVTAENGTKKTYTITVNRAAGSEGGSTGGNGGQTTQNPDATPSPSPTATPEPEVMVTLPDDTQLSVSAQLPEDVTVPQGFEVSQLELDGQSVATIVHKEGGLTAVYLKGDEGHTAGFYFLNEKTLEVQPMAQVNMASGKLVLVDLPQDLELPEGYSSTLTELGGQQRTLLAPDGVEEPNHYIVCALDEQGTLGLYLYDVEQGSFQRYQFVELAQEEEPEQPQEPEETGFVIALFGREIQTNWNNQVVSYILAGLALLGVVLLIVVIVLVVCLVKSRRALYWAQMRLDQEQQEMIVVGPGASGTPTKPETPGMTVDDILAEYKDKE